MTTTSISAIIAVPLTRMLNCFKSFCSQYLLLDRRLLIKSLLLDWEDQQTNQRKLIWFEHKEDIDFLPPTTEKLLPNAWRDLATTRREKFLKYAKHSVASRFKPQPTSIGILYPILRNAKRCHIFTMGVEFLNLGTCWTYLPVKTYCHRRSLYPMLTQIMFQ